MYTSKNFKTKKALKEALALWLDYAGAVSQALITADVEHPEANRLAAISATSAWLRAHGLRNPPAELTVYQHNSDITGFKPPPNGWVSLEGPHYPEPHRWHAQALLANGHIVKLK